MINYAYFSPTNIRYFMFFIGNKFFKRKFKISKPVASKLSSSELVPKFACLNKFQE